MQKPLIPPAEMLETPLEELRALTIEQRGNLIIAACESAAAIAAGREKMGLPRPEPVPWPASTLEFFRRHSPNGRTA